jgi:hypothetical protein
VAHFSKADRCDEADIAGTDYGNFGRFTHSSINQLPHLRA